MTKRADIARVETGARDLDAPLAGGLAKGSASIVGGPPGSGKTILSTQICFPDATPARPALYINTPSEPTAKGLRHVRPVVFFGAAKVETAVRFVDLGVLVPAEGLGPAAFVMDHLMRVKPAPVVVGGFKVFDDLEVSRERRRKFGRAGGQLDGLAADGALAGRARPARRRGRPALFDRRRPGVGRHLVAMRERVGAPGARRAAVDSASVLLHKVDDPQIAREKVFQLASAVHNGGAVGFFSTDIPYGAGRLSRFGVEEAVVDGVNLAHVDARRARAAALPRGLQTSQHRALRGTAQHGHRSGPRHHLPALRGRGRAPRRPAPGRVQAPDVGRAGRREPADARGAVALLRRRPVRPGPIARGRRRRLAALRTGTRPAQADASGH
jgi:hypothetical protein